MPMRIRYFKIRTRRAKQAPIDLTDDAVKWIASLALAMTDKTLAFLAFFQIGDGRPIAASKPKFI
jgi:hypothetical protein